MGQDLPGRHLGGGSARTRSTRKPSVSGLTSTVARGAIVPLRRTEILVAFPLRPGHAGGEVGRAVAQSGAAVGRARSDVLEVGQDERHGAPDHRDQDHAQAREEEGGPPAPPGCRGGEILRSDRDPEGVDRAGNVLETLLADVLVDGGDLAVDRLPQGARDADSAGMGQRLQAGRDVDAVPQQIAVHLHHVADGDPDPEFDATVLRVGLVALAQGLLDLEGGAQGFDRARELGEDRVPRDVEDPAMGAGDAIPEDGAVLGQPAQGVFLVLGGQARIACDVGREDDCDRPLHRSTLRRRSPLPTRLRLPVVVMLLRCALRRGSDGGRLDPMDRPEFTRRSRAVVKTRLAFRPARNGAEREVQAGRARPTVSTRRSRPPGSSRRRGRSSS
jgi:hypothetical protein